MGTRELRGNNSDAGHWLHLGANPRDWRTHGKTGVRAPAFASVRRGEVTSRLFYESQCAAVERIEAICEQPAISRRGSYRRCRSPTQTQPGEGAAPASIFCRIRQIFIA